MADDPERDIFPTKETKNPSIISEIHVSQRHNAYEKRSVPHLSRDDLEDQFYKFKEENFQLKKSAKKQEENLKKLATKMSRLLREKKSMESMNSPSHKRDLELEEIVEDLQDKVRQLEKTNSHLREKMLVAKQQVIMQVKRPYSHIPPKVNSGNVTRSGMSAYASSVNLRGKNIQNFSKKTGTTTLPPYALSLLEEARIELSNLKMLLSNQKSEIEQYEHENEILKQKLRMREIEFEDELNMMRSQLTQRQRQHVQENLELIRLHRELKQKNANYVALQTQFNEMEEKMRILKLKHDHLVKEMEDLSSRFKEEQKKNLELLGELQKAQLSLATTTELQERLALMQKENDFLRETNDKFVKNALTIEKERVVAVDDRKHVQVEEMLKEKISNLELSLNIQNKEKVVVLEELTKEKEANAAKEQSLSNIKKSFDHLQSQMTELETKMNVLKTYDVQFEDLEEAVILLKQKRENKLDSTNKVPEISSEELESLKFQLKKKEEEHTETLKELQNLQDILKTQYDANNVAHDEIKSLSEKLEHQGNEFETKIQEYLHLLDLRSARIQKLEKQLNDIAYGTQTFQTDFPDIDGKHFQTVELTKGENIFEIHIVKVNFTSEGVKHFYSSNPKVFLTWNFYEFELQSTPVLSAKSPVFNYTAQYTVQVDDYFLCYLLEKTVNLELHESLGVTFKTFACCQLNFSKILSKSSNKIHGKQQLIGNLNNTAINFGSVEFWIKLQIPMEEAFKYFKEKLKALTYIHSNKEKSKAAVNLLQQPTQRDAFVNDLHIKILRGINIKSQHKDLQPSTFCVYKFFNLPDQDTTIVPASNNPEYSDHRTFSIFINPDVENYLKTENLYIYVFDDNELELTSHIGKVSVPLQSLLQNNPIKGTFELKKNGESGFGAIEILIYWQFEYTPASSDISAYKLLQPKELLINSSLSSSITTSSDEEITVAKLPTVDLSYVQPPVPKPRKSILSTPMTSTPVIRDSLTSVSDPEERDNCSSDISPIHHKDDLFSSYENSPKSSSNELKVSAEVHSTMDALSMTNKPPVPLPRKKSFPLDSSDEEKLAFSDDSTEEFEDETEMHTSDRLESTITICINHLVLRSDASVLQDTSIKMLYVDYRFLDYPLEELETPFSLPKVASPNLIKFNFEKVFTLKSNDIEKWKLLSKMLFSNIPESSLMKFTVVSEPPSDAQDLDCEEIGYGIVDLKEILLNQEDKIQEDITIYDVDDTSIEIGNLNVSIEVLDALTKLKNSMGS